MDIQGSGGILGKKPKSQVNLKDTGLSNSFIYIKDVVGEQIEGIRQIYLDNTPVFDSNGNNVNFPGVTFEIRKGDVLQDLPASRTGTSIVRSVGVEVKNIQNATRQYVNPNIDKLIVTTRFTLQDSTDEKKGTVSATCRYRILLKSGSGAFVAVVERDISGLYRSPIEVQDEIEINNIGGTIDTFQVRLEKLSPDSSNQNLTRTMEWVSTSEVTTDRITYEKTSYVEIGFPSSIFNGEVPRQYEVDGFIFKIPSNAVVNPVDGGLDFSGLWNGTLYRPTLACSDPAWQLLGILTDDFFGAGEDIGVSDINVADLYNISRHNNEYISDGNGGLERRYLCVTVINSRDKASKLLENLCSNMNVKYYSQGGQLRFWQDKKNDIVDALITNSDVIDGTFRIGFSGAQSQSTLYNVVWNNPLIDFQRDIEPVRYHNGMKELGVISEEIVSYGVYRKSQAIRFGRRAIFDNWLNTKTINFKMRPKGIFLHPGKIIEVCDNKKLRYRSSGFVSSFLPNYLTLDSEVALLPNLSYVIKVTRPDGTVEERNVLNSEGITRNIIPHINFSAVEPESTWILKSSLGETEKFIILDAIIDKDLNVEIIGIKYDPDKQDYIETGFSLDNDPKFNGRPPDIVEKPQNINHDRLITGDYLAIFFIWDVPASLFIKGFLVEISRDGISWGSFQQTIYGQYSFLLENALEGFYQIRVASIDILNKASDWSYSEQVYISRSSVDMDLGNPFSFEY